VPGGSDGAALHATAEALAVALRQPLLLADFLAAENDSDAAAEARSRLTTQLLARLLLGPTAAAAAANAGTARSGVPPLPAATTQFAAAARRLCRPYLAKCVSTS